MLGYKIQESIIMIIMESELHLVTPKKQTQTNNDNNHKNGNNCPLWLRLFTMICSLCMSGACMTSVNSVSGPLCVAIYIHSVQLLFCKNNTVWFQYEYKRQKQAAWAPKKISHQLRAGGWFFFVLGGADHTIVWTKPVSSVSGADLEGVATPPPFCIHLYIHANTV